MAPEPVYSPFSLRPGVRVRWWEGTWKAGVLRSAYSGDYVRVREDGGRDRVLSRREVEGEIGP